jgi:hypothetical protein
VDTPPPPPPCGSALKVGGEAKPLLPAVGANSSSLLVAGTLFSADLIT